VITILEPAEAMRLLVAGNRPRVLGAAALMAAALIFLGATAFAIIAGL
jgi:hypothetical protein